MQKTPLRVPVCTDRDRAAHNEHARRSFGRRFSRGLGRGGVLRRLERLNAILHRLPERLGGRLIRLRAQRSGLSFDPRSGLGDLPRPQGRCSEPRGSSSFGALSLCARLHRRHPSQRRYRADVGLRLHLGGLSGRLRRRHPQRLCGFLKRSRG